MVNTTTLKAMIGNGNLANFTRYFDGNLWYEVRYSTDYTGTPSDLYTGAFSSLEFPVPVADIGGATFLAQDKAILFMRYIRKHMEMLEKAKTELTDA